MSAKKTYVIKTSIGLVAGFGGDSVKIAQTADFAKLFTSRAQAEKFIERYADKGYGLGSGDAEIVG